MFTLDGYQRRAIDAARDLARQGSRATLLIAPTGAGKTVIGSAINRGAVSKGKTSCWIAHRRELVTQAARTMERFGIDVGFHGLNAQAPVQVTSLQTILARRELPSADIYFFDEAHHVVADEWSEIPRAVIAMGKRIFGFTATPERGDGRPLGSKSGGIFDAMHVVAQISELQAINEANPARGLVRCDWKSPAARVKSGQIAMAPCDAWYQFARGRAAVVFAPNVKSAETFASEFEARGVKCAVVHGELSNDERDRRLADFASGRVDVLCNVAVLTEGWDCPRAKVCILARPCGSTGLYLQIVGRVLRATGKVEAAMLLDLVGAVDAHGPPDIDREFQLDGEFGIGRAGAKAGVRYCKTCGGELSQDDSGAWLPCEDCGRVVEGPKVPGVAGVALDKWEWTKKLNVDARAEWLAREYSAALAKKQRLSTAHHRFRGVFKHYPPQAIVNAAMKLARVPGHAV